MIAGGKVYLVGAGPGDPGLLTLKGRRCLQDADVVIHDALVDVRILDFAKPEAHLLSAGKDLGGRSVPQQAINRLMCEHAMRGKTVVRLKDGDPMLFGRGGEEAEELAAAGIPFEVVPGVTPALAALAYAGIPLTHRDHAPAIAIVSGHEDVEDAAPHLDWAAHAGAGRTLVFLMGTRPLRNTMQRLMTCGLPTDTPVALVCGGIKADQQVLTGTVSTIAKHAVQEECQPPAVVVVGDVVRLRERLAWFESKPLFGKRIAVTRPRAEAGRFAELLEARGAEVFRFPTIETVPPASYRELDMALDALADYDWLVFTSVNGVRFFFERLQHRRQDIRDLARVRIAAIGPETARSVEACHLRVDTIPDAYVAEALIDVLKAENAQRILLPRAAEARAVLPDALRAFGARVDEVAAYRTIRPRVRTEMLRDLLRAGRLDLLTFTSSSTVRNFMTGFSDGAAADLLGDVHVGCIGPITAATARQHGLRVTIQPAAYTIPAFADAIVAYFQGSEPRSER